MFNGDKNIEEFVLNSYRFSTIKRVYYSIILYLALSRCIVINTKTKLSRFKVCNRPYHFRTISSRQPLIVGTLFIWCAALCVIGFVFGQALPKWL